MKSPAVSIRRLAAEFPVINERWYVIAKLSSDPLYDAVFHELESTDAPLLDIGCGMGVLAFYLRARGWRPWITGFDYDPRKIVTAKLVAAQLGPDTDFTAGDARTGLPEHCGSVTILDILQYFTPAEQRNLLLAAAARVGSGGVLIIRSGLDSRSWRGRVTRAGDWFARVTNWMQEHASHYPTADFLQNCLTEAGLRGGLRPLWGRTPFNNWLGVWQRAEEGAGGTGTDKLV